MQPVCEICGRGSCISGSKDLQGGTLQRSVAIAASRNSALSRLSLLSLNNSGTGTQLMSPFTFLYVAPTHQNFIAGATKVPTIVHTIMILQRPLQCKKMPQKNAVTCDCLPHASPHGADVELNSGETQFLWFPRPRRGPWSKLPAFCFVLVS